MGYRNDIQGLRALAVLFVFIFHLNSSWLPGGFIGVDIFFVISGCLISSIIIYEIENKKFNVFKFYEKRIKRIVPAYYIVLLVIAIVGAIFFLTTDLEKLKTDLWYSLAFV